MFELHVYCSTLVYPGGDVCHQIGVTGSPNFHSPHVDVMAVLDAVQKSFPRSVITRQIEHELPDKIREGLSKLCPQLVVVNLYLENNGILEKQIKSL